MTIAAEPDPAIPPPQPAPETGLPEPIGIPSPAPDTIDDPMRPEPLGIPDPMPDDMPPMGPEEVPPDAPGVIIF